MARDNFPASVRRVIAERVNFLCSNPTCRRGTVGPQLDAARSLSLGVAAHIAAASPGGPRFDPRQRGNDRKSAVNGVWLCQNCAKLIDSDLLRHPGSLLKRWKDAAERLASHNLGQGLFGLDGRPQPLDPTTSIFSRAMSLPSDLGELFPAGVPPQHEASVLLEDINAFGQRLAVIGLKAPTRDWTLYYFVRGEAGWRSETEIEIPFQKYAPPAVTYIPGAPGALDIVHLTGSGTGVMRASHTIYRVGFGANRTILSFPQMFYVSGWGMPFRRELRLVDLERPPALQSGAELHLQYEVSYHALKDFEDTAELFTDRIHLRLVWDDALQMFSPATEHDDFALLDDIWDENTDGFLSRNRERLISLRKEGTEEQRAFVQAYLG